MIDNSSNDTQNENIPSQIISSELISDLVPDILAQVDVNKKYVWLNKAGLDFFGKDAIGVDASKFFVGEQNTYEEVDKLFNGDKDSVYLESWQFRKDGQKRLLAWWCRSLKDDQGNFIGALSSAHDITQRVKAEEMVKKSQLFLQNIIDLLPIRIFWKDENLKFLGCNMAVAKDGGKTSPAELIGKDDYEMPWKEQADAYRSDDLSVMRSGEPKLEYEEEQTTSSGKKIYLITNKVPLKDNSGKIVGVLGTYDDITEKKQSEEGLKKALAETRKMNDLLIDRELKMVSMKKELAELKQQQSEPEQS